MARDGASRARRGTSGVDPRGLAARARAATSSGCGVATYSEDTVEDRQAYLRPLRRAGARSGRSRGRARSPSRSSSATSATSSTTARRTGSRCPSRASTTSSCRCGRSSSGSPATTTSSTTPPRSSSCRRLRAAAAAARALGAPRPSACSRSPTSPTPLGLRDRAILETFYSTGMRRMELIAARALRPRRRARHGDGAPGQGQARTAWCRSASGRSPGSRSTSPRCGRRWWCEPTTGRSFSRTTGEPLRAGLR